MRSSTFSSRASVSPLKQSKATIREDRKENKENISPNKLVKSRTEKDSSIHSSKSSLKMNQTSGSISNKKSRLTPVKLST